MDFEIMFYSFEASALVFRQCDELEEGTESIIRYGFRVPLRVVFIKKRLELERFPSGNEIKLTETLHEWKGRKHYLGTMSP